MPKPTKELKSTPFTEVIELERIVTPDEEKRVDHIFVRRKKICTRHPRSLQPLSPPSLIFAIHRQSCSRVWVLSLIFILMKKSEVNQYNNKTTQDLQHSPDHLVW